MVSFANLEHQPADSQNLYLNNDLHLCYVTTSSIQRDYMWAVYKASRLQGNGVRRTKALNRGI